MRARLRTADDRGQVSVEFLGLTPLILLVLVLLWQFVLVGYTFTLAGHAADKGARAGTVTGAGACAAAATEDLPGAWQEGAVTNCGAQGGLYKATVRLKVPVLFPGAVGFPWPVSGTAGVVREEPEGWGE